MHRDSGDVGGIQRVRSVESRPVLLVKCTTMHKDRLNQVSECVIGEVIFLRI